MGAEWVAEVQTLVRLNSDGVGVNCLIGIVVDNNNNANNNIIAYMFLSTEGGRKYNVLWVRTGEFKVSGDL